MDVSTLLGVLGVILTILFFAIGYRQTIGARKERARAANKEAIDTLFRRLTLEDGFSVNLPGIGKLLTGLALEANVRLTDLYSHKQLEAVLYARLLDSDYINSEGRKDAMSRLERSFRESASEELQADARARLNTGLFGARVIDSGKGLIDSVYWLAGASTIAGFVFVVIATNLINSKKSPISFENILRTPEFISVAFLTIATSVVLVFYVQLRESNRSTSNGDEIDAHPEEMERAFFVVSRSYNNSIKMSGYTWADFSFVSEGKNCAIEFKSDVNKLGVLRVRELVANLTKNCKEDGVSQVYLVSGSIPLDKIRRLENSFVRIVSVSEMWKKLEEKSAAVSG